MSAAQPTSPKAAHYHAALTSALLRGAWGDANPGSAPNGTPLSWGELVRKWGKHTGGNTDLIHRIRDISLLYLSASTSSSGFITVPPSAQASLPATTPVATSASIPAGGSNSSADETASGSSFIHVPHPHLRRHKSRSSNDVPPSQRLQSPAGGSRAAYLSSGDLDGDDLPDGANWAVGNGWWSGVGPNEIDEVKEGLAELESTSRSNASAGEQMSIQLAKGYYLHTIGRHEEALLALEGVANADTRAGVVEGDAAVLEKIRARTLSGLSAELQRSADSQLALRHYTSIIPLISSFTSLTPSRPVYLSDQPPRSPFDSTRELYRWISTALSRAAILTARTADSNAQTLQVLRTYHAYSSTWPAAFRPLQRQRMLQLYMRALYSGYPTANTSPLTPYTLDSSISASGQSARALWRKETVDALRQGRALLSATTTFPRAGSINAPVTHFTNLAVALADRCSMLQLEVIGVLWWAMTLTFQSQSILRHLTRLQTAQGDVKEARRTFELYVQLTLKARETQQPEISLQLKRRPTEDHPAGPKQIAREAEEAKEEDTMPGRQGQISEVEIDSDAQLVEALLVGSRLLLKELGEAEEAWRYITLAGDVVEIADKGRHRLSIGLQAQVEEVKGIIRMAMGMRGADPVSRPKYQAQAINHLKASTELNGNSAVAFYHLAFCQAEARSIETALLSIRRSLELDSRNVQAWHLLALILTAQNDWDAAAKAGEAGVSVWEQDEEKELSEEEAVTPDDAAVASKDFGSALEDASTDTATEPLLLPTGNFHPPHLNSKLPYSALTRAKRLENVIRLRMTLNVITEKTQGADMAMLRQQELFAFFSGRSGKNRTAGGVGLSKGLTGSASFSGVPNQEKDLGGSYISIDVPAIIAPADGQGTSLIASVQPPTPISETVQSSNVSTAPGAPVVLAPAIPGHSIQSSPSGSVATSEAESPDDREGTEKHGKDHKEKKSLGKRLVAKHLHVPHGGSGRSSRPSSVRRLQLPNDATAPRPRNASTSSMALSTAPTTAHSHFHSATPASIPPPPVTPARQASEHNAAELRILSNLWLMSAATFRRWQKPEQCLVAIEEAEVLDPENPDVWVQLGLYHVAATPPNYTAALPAFTKALLLRPDHPPSLVNLSKLYLATGQTELAHSLLNQMTQDAGWDVSEAWFYLGKVCEVQGRVERSRECWKYALELEETRPARRWEDAVDRC